MASKALKKIIGNI